MVPQSLWYCSSPLVKLLEASVIARVDWASNSTVEPKPLAHSHLVKLFGNLTIGYISGLQWAKTGGRSRKPTTHASFLIGVCSNTRTEHRALENGTWLQKQVFIICGYQAAVLHIFEQNVSHKCPQNYPQNPTTDFLFAGNTKILGRTKLQTTQWFRGFPSTTSPRLSTPSSNGAGAVNGRACMWGKGPATITF